LIERALQYFLCYLAISQWITTSDGVDKIHLHHQQRQSRRAPALPSVSATSFLLYGYFNASECGMGDLKLKAITTHL
jgi:hypothetical protein